MASELILHPQPGQLDSGACSLTHQYLAHERPHQMTVKAVSAVTVGHRKAIGRPCHRVNRSNFVDRPALSELNR